jgi:hypothetical protein
MVGWYPTPIIVNPVNLGYDPDWYNDFQTCDKDAREITKHYIESYDARFNVSLKAYCLPFKKDE